MRKLSVKWEPDYWREHNLPDNGCFGYVAGQLVLGRAHHQLIMGNFLYKGWTFEQLMMAPQAWGWYTVNPIKYYEGYFPNFNEMKEWQKNSYFVLAQFTSDAGIQVDKEVQAALGAFATKYRLPAKLSQDSKVRGVVEENFGTGLRGLPNMDKYLENPGHYFGPEFLGENPHLLHGVPQPPGSEWDPDWSDTAVKPEDAEKVDEPKPEVKPSLTLKGDFSQYNVGDKIRIIYEGWNNIETITHINPHDVHAIDEEGNEHVWSLPSSIQKVAPEGDELYGVYKVKGVDTKLDYVGPGEAYWINDAAGSKNKVFDLASVPKWIQNGEITKMKDDASPFTGYEGVYLNTMHPETSNHLHVTPESAVWKHPTTGAIVGESVLGSDSIIKQIDEGKLQKMPSDLGGFYQGDGFSVHYDAENNKATWHYTSGSTLGPSYVSPMMVQKYIGEGSWNFVSADNFKEPKTVIGPNVPLDGPQVGDKFYYTPDMEMENPQVYTVSEVSPNMVRITWPKMISPDGVGYDTETFNKVFTKTSSLSKEAYTPGGKTKGWGDIMEKANYIRSQNGVNIINNEPQHVTGTVMSATDPREGPYQTEIWRDDPQSQAITMWDCTCPWDDYAWGRTRQWKKYEGRPCAHVLALFWDALTKPPEGSQTAPAAPPTPAPGGGVTVNQGLIAPMGQPPMNVPLIGPDGEPAPIAPEPGGPTNPAAMPWSEVVQPGKGEGTITFPGTFSHRKQATKITEVGTDSHVQDPDDPERPWLYHPESDTLYLGPEGAFHYSIMEHFLDHNIPFTEQDDYPHGYLTENGYAKTYTGGYPPRGALDQLGIFKVHENNKPMPLSELRDSSWKEASAPTDPPNYRKKDKPNEACGVCKMMYEGKCWGYGNTPVGEDMVCDSFTPETQKTSEWLEELQAMPDSFKNGDIVRVWEECPGEVQEAYGVPGYPVMIPKNTSGEVLSSNPETTVAIFPLNTGPLEHHLVKVECPTKNLYLDNTNAQPFVKKH